MEFIEVSYVEPHPHHHIKPDRYENLNNYMEDCDVKMMGTECI